MKLSDRVEALAGDIGPFNPIREDIARAIGWRFVREGHPIGCVWYDPDGRARALPDWPADLNAAMSLVPEGWDWLSRSDEAGAFANVSRPDATNFSRLYPAGTMPEPEVVDALGRAQGHNYARSATPALALLAAALRARGL